MKWVIPLLFLATTASASFSGYTYERALTIDHTKVSTYTLTYVNIPVLVSTTDVSLSTSSAGGHLSNPNAFDLVFSTKNDCSFLLNWDTETFNNTGSTATNVFVNIPSISSSTDTVFYMCYGNSSVTSYLGVSTMAWNSNYKAVYHLGDNASTTNVKDSTFNMNIATNAANTNTKLVAGQIDGALTYNGTSDVTNLSEKLGLPIFSTNGYTVSMWINSSATAGYFFDETHSASTNSFFGIAATTANKLIILLRNESDTLFLNNVISTKVVADGTWHYVVFSDSNGVAALYIDGVQDLTNYTYTPSGSFIFLSDAIGAQFRAGTTNNFLAGNLDEVELSSVALSSGTIQTIYNNQSSPHTFYSYGQENGGSPSVTINSPVSGQVIQSPATFQLTASTVSAPTAYSVEWDIDGKRWAVGYTANPNLPVPDYRDPWLGKWTVNMYPGLFGDGPHFVDATVRDIFGVFIASAPTVNFVVRVQGMSNQSIAISGSSGTVMLDLHNWDGSFQGSLYIDGWFGHFGDTTQPLEDWGGNPTSIAGIGIRYPNDKTYRFPNGLHEVMMSYGIFSGDPLVKNSTFSATNVSGSSITVPNHFGFNNTVVVFYSTGILPSPLVPGVQAFFGTSATSTNTATITVAGGTMTIVSNNPLGVVAGTPVYIQNVSYTEQVNGTEPCAGYFTALSSNSSTSFNVLAPPGCPNGVTGGNSFSVYVNPYFVNYVDSNTVTVSATPGGPPVVMSNGGSGIHTMAQRMRSTYYCPHGKVGDLLAPSINDINAPTTVITHQTFNNGTYPMELRPPYRELYMLQGSSISICPIIENTDLSTTTIACNTTGLNYQEVDDGGVSGVCSVDSSGNVSATAPGWCIVNVGCNGTCNSTGFGEALTTVTIHVSVSTPTITFPHFTHSGLIANTYTPGQSFYPLGVWGLYAANGTTAAFGSSNGYEPFLGPMMQDANMNYAWTYGFNPTQIVEIGNVERPSCPTYPDVWRLADEAFATEYNIYLESDLFSSVWNGPEGNGSNGPGALAGFLSNVQYDRQTCLKQYIAHDVTYGRIWRYFVDDEASGEFNEFLMPNPNIGGPNWSNATTSAGSVTFNVSGVNLPSAWNQATGQGGALKVIGATTNSCLNGWYLLSSASASQWVAPTTCSNGITISSTSDPSAQLIFTYFAAACIGSDPSNSCDQWATLPNNYDSNEQFLGNSPLTSINCTATPSCTVHWTLNGITTGTAIRIHSATTSNVNIVSTATVVDTDTFKITYPGTTGGVAPAAVVITSVTDPSLFVTVDANYPPNPLGVWRSVIKSVANAPAIGFSMLGSLFTVTNSSGVYSWMGNPNNVDAAMDYFSTQPHSYNSYGYDSTTMEWLKYGGYADATVNTRPWQTQARIALHSDTTDYQKMYQKDFRFNPGRDRPQVLSMRPEGSITQRISMLMTGVSALRNYQFLSDTVDQYISGVGYSSNAGGSDATSQIVMPKRWAAMSYTNALIHRLEKYILQPNTNKPYYGPMVLTDAHTSSYGNELMILCGSEMPYPQTINLTQMEIAGGSLYKALLNGYHLKFVPMANVSTDTICGSSNPSEVITYIAQPAGIQSDLDNMLFSSPASLPSGATKYLIQVGYYPKGMQDDPVTDCTNGCSIPVNHYNANAWYRIIYANSNSQPLIISDPQKIPAVSP